MSDLRLQPWFLKTLKGSSATSTNGSCVTVKTNNLSNCILWLTKEVHKRSANDIAQTVSTITVKDARKQKVISHDSVSVNCTAQRLNAQLLKLLRLCCAPSSLCVCLCVCVVCMCVVLLHLTSYLEHNQVQSSIECKRLMNGIHSR